MDVEDQDLALEELNEELNEDYTPAGDGMSFGAPGKRTLTGTGVSMEMGDDKRRAGAPDVSFRLLCPSAMTGSIIGKGGDVIAALRSETGARIKVEESVQGCNERVVSIYAADTPEADTCPSQAALLRVVEKLGENTDEADESFCIRLLVWSSQTGAVIGKAGAVINELRQSTGAQIRVLPKQEVPACAAPDDEVCQMVGTFDKVYNAALEISGRLRQNPPKDRPSGRPAAPQYHHVHPGAGPVGYGNGMGMGMGMGPGAGLGHPAMVMPRMPAGFAPESGVGVEVLFRMAIPAGKAGGLIGKGGEIIKRIREETGARVKLTETGEGGDWRMVELLSVEDPMSPFCAAQEALMRCHHRLLEDTTVPMPGGTRLLVPKTQVGAVLGKGGSVIKSIRQETGATVRVISKDQVPQEVAHEDDEIVMVDGPPYAVDAALRAITLRLRGQMSRNVQRSGDAGGGHLHPMGGHGPVGGPPRHVQAVRMPAGEDVGSIYLRITPEQVGGVIGKGGSNITQIRQISGASVRLHDGEAGGDRQLEITGTTQQCQSAQSLVQAFLFKNGGGALSAE